MSLPIIQIIRRKGPILVRLRGLSPKTINLMSKVETAFVPVEFASGATILWPLGHKLCAPSREGKLRGHMVLVLLGLWELAPQGKREKVVWPSRHSSLAVKDKFLAVWTSGSEVPWGP